MDDRDGLLVRFVYRDTDRTGELGVQVRSGGFAGAAAAWFGDDELLGFSGRLTACPLGDSRPGISGGYTEDGHVAEYVGLTARAVGRRGQVGVLVHLATAIEHPGSSTGEVRVEVMTSYEALGRFAAQLRQLVEGTADEARLDAEEVGR
ncbi:hypothetical protein GB931_14025 [Modestobacter sp. I12A-02628]|uniref:Uncharacterized protein n=1 Tax=Goekera deserti TaxID=2497753 RepID=A0A7K3WHF2_9ACTN|nr:hypothetical protein [Goekera deserti]MPQ99020.1 hypothetical protein [Goekera deserti]NDI47354.1 hypothetical protein [Goekera deserti]NEL55884.1 hypothetical protein [Goekera deserti]